MEEILICNQMCFTSDKDNQNLEELAVEDINYYSDFSIVFYMINERQPGIYCIETPVLDVTADALILSKWRGEKKLYVKLEFIANQNHCTKCFHQRNPSAETEGRLPDQCLACHS